MTVSPTIRLPDVGVRFFAPTSAIVDAFLAGRRQVVAATGHRPDKLLPRATTTLPPLPASLLGTDRAARDPFGLYTTCGWQALVRFAQDELRCADADAVITGGALGWDQVVASAALALHLPLMVCHPFETQASRWPPYAQAIWRQQADEADVAVCVTPVLSLLADGARSVRDLDVPAMKAAMDCRNRYMLDRAHLVLDLHDGSRGGTGNAVRYARTRQLPLAGCWLRYVARFIQPS